MLTCSMHTHRSLALVPATAGNGIALVPVCRCRVMHSRKMSGEGVHAADAERWLKADD